MSSRYPRSPVAGPMREFQQGPPVDRGDIPLRVDLPTAYDRAALVPVPVAYADGIEDDPTAFRFQGPSTITSLLTAMALR